MHWLPVTFGVHFNTYIALRGLGPVYMKASLIVRASVLSHLRAAEEAVSKSQYGPKPVWWHLKTGPSL